MLRPQFPIHQERARLTGAEVRDGFYERMDLRGAVAQSSLWLGTTFVDCDLSAGAFGDATIDRCVFLRCAFKGTVLVSRIYRTRFEACNLDGAILTGADVQGSKFLRSRAQRSDWSRATLIDTKLELDLRAANLNFALTRGVDFTGANLWSALFPLNCAGFIDNTFDDRQVEMLLCLLNGAKGPKPLLAALKEHISPWYRAVFRKIVRVQGLE